jgi:RNA polymerase sigma-70 factor (ECF subfamily)
MLGLAYRMLGDVARAEDVVQDAWLRWQRRDVGVDRPKAYLIKTVARLCLNELDSARARKEEARGDRLPEPIDLENTGILRIERLDRISMAFLVLLQRLTPAERAVLLLHEVFEFEHDEIANLIEKSEPACRQLLKRAREHIANERRTLTVAPEVHRRLLRSFIEAASSGDIGRVASLLADDVVLVADAGPDGGVYGRVRNLPGPIVGSTKVAAFVAAVAPQGAEGLVVQEHELNGQPGVLILRDGRPYTAMLLATAGERIRAVFIHADPERLRHILPLPAFV